MRSGDPGVRSRGGGGRLYSPVLPTTTTQRAWVWAAELCDGLPARDTSIAAVHPNCVAVDTALEAAGCSGRVQLLPAAARTAAAAAALVGVDVGAIANSLVFATAENEPVLVLTSGAHRVDTTKVAALL